MNLTELNDDDDDISYIQTLIGVYLFKIEHCALWFVRFRFNAHVYRIFRFGTLNRLFRRLVRQADVFLTLRISHHAAVK